MRQWSAGSVGSLHSMAACEGRRSQPASTSTVISSSRRNSTREHRPKRYRPTTNTADPLVWEYVPSENTAMQRFVRPIPRRIVAHTGQLLRECATALCAR